MKGEIMAKGKDNQETTKQSNPRETKSEQGSGQTTGEQTSLSRRENFAPAVWASPFSFMRRFGEDMDRLFEDFGFPRGLMPRGFTQMAEWSPQVEVTERDGQLVVRADLPGLSKDDVEVELRDETIIIRGQRKQEREEKREGYYRSERSYGSFYRQIPLPKGSDTEKATANFNNGVLEITMSAPKGEERGRQLQIQDTQASGQPQTKAQAAGTGR
jgi:HSP20 family protein